MKGKDGASVLEVLLATYRDELTAETVVGRLRTAGIAARVRFESDLDPGRAGRVPGAPAQHYRVYVRAADATRARRLMGSRR